MQRAPLINIGVEIKEFDRSSLPRRAGSRPRLRLDKLLSIKCEWVLNLDFGDCSRNGAEIQTLFMKGSEAAFTEYIGGLRGERFTAISPTYRTNLFGYTSRKSPRHPLTALLGPDYNLTDLLPLATDIAD